MTPNIPNPTEADRLLAELGNLSKHATRELGELFRRARISIEADGYPSQRQDGGRSSDVADPTGNLATEVRPGQLDIVEMWGRAAAAELADSLVALRHLSRLLTLARRLEDGSRGRDNSARNCGGCGRVVAQSASDRLRAGLCDACRKWKARAEAASGGLLSLHDVARVRMQSSENVSTSC